MRRFRSSNWTIAIAGTLPLFGVLFLWLTGDDLFRFGFLVSLALAIGALIETIRRFTRTS